MVEAYWELTDKLVPFVFTAEGFVKLTREAQKNAKVIEEETPVGASALIVKNTAQKLLADFYYKISPPKRPLKVFKD